MADHGLTEVLQSLRRTLSPPGGDQATDGQLLARFVDSRDEAAFATLVRRHGPMVYGVCRRVLGRDHDAEDAFQAAFLVLARKAGAVVKRESVGSWLYGVAHRTALEARSALARLRARERQTADLPHPAVGPAEPQDWRPLLDRELSRLPEKYRAAVVLCDLEGRPRKEAAVRLRVPEGTLSSRLAAARRILARRLTLRGLTLSGGGLSAALSGGAALAAPPAALASATVHAATLAASGLLAAVSAGAAVLTKGVLRALWTSKLRAMLALVLTATAASAVGFVCPGAWTAGGGAPRSAYRAEAPTEALAKNEPLNLNDPPARAEAAELDAQQKQPQPDAAVMVCDKVEIRFSLSSVSFELTPDPEAEAEAAFEALRSAQGEEDQARATDALEKALMRLHEATSPPCKE
jgi:RNA polymerase sigma factor (sigma-70 family)